MNEPRKFQRGQKLVWQCPRHAHEPPMPVTYMARIGPMRPWLVVVTWPSGRNGIVDERTLTELEESCEN